MGSLWLRLYGADQPLALKHMPRTMGHLASLRGVVLSAMVSIMEPGVSLEHHRGDFKGVLRYHLALEVPARGDSVEFPELAVARDLFPRTGESMHELEPDEVFTKTWEE